MRLHVKPLLRSIQLCYPLVLLLASSGAAQNAADTGTLLPTFTTTATVGGSDYTYTLAGGDPAKGGTTTIPVLLVPITLTIEAPMDAAGHKAVLEASSIAENVIRSPLFAKYAFGAGDTQYIDAMLRTEFYSQGGGGDWHTLLGTPKVAPLHIDVPVWDGYVMTSKKTGGMLAMVDERYVQDALFAQLSNVTPGTLVIAVTRDVTYYVHDATECCTWGTYGTDTSHAGRTPFVLSSYLDARVVDEDKDVQPITEFLAEFFHDPLHDGLYRERRGERAPGNAFPGWLKSPAKAAREQPQENSDAGGTNADPTFSNEPTDTNWKNRTPASKAFVATVGGVAYHLENVALLDWYNEVASPTSLHGAYSFPDEKALTEAAKPVPVRRRDGEVFGSMTASPEDAVPPVAITGGQNGHKLVGYWAGYGPIEDVSPQWDIIIVAFATPDHAAGEGQMQYRYRVGREAATPEQMATLKAAIKQKQSAGKKVMISLGGGGQRFTLDTQEGKERFIKSVEEICAEYGFDGIDIDFEASSMNLIPGDTDPRHPISPTTVNLIAAMRAIHDHFGKNFMLSLVPEGQQTSAAGAAYGGQFGSYVPIIEGIRDILSFTDTQDYNCPPVEGLDGEYYMPGSVDYHAAATEQFLHGFYVGHNPKYYFAPLPPDKVVVGYLNSDTTPEIVAESMRALTTGKSRLMTRYTMQRPGGYPTFTGAMFWTIDDDRREQYRYSNVVGPELHSFRASAMTAKQTTAGGK